MRSVLESARKVLYVLRAVVAFALYQGSPERSKIERDMQRWDRRPGVGRHRNLRSQHAWLMARFPEFRAVFWFRVRQSNLMLVKLGKLAHRPPRTPQIAVGELGGGLFIQHGFSSIIVADKIGEDCWINQQVTIGHDGRGCPTIGDRVTIAAGAVVIGSILIGDDVTIGANTTVTKDVPSGATVVGPAFRILGASGQP